MSFEQFEMLASQGYNNIPVTRELFADLDTPLSVYAKLAQGDNTYLLESVESNEKWGRYSIIGLPCREQIKVFGQQLQRIDNGEVVETLTLDDPLAYIQEYCARFHVPHIDGLPKYSGGLVGYMGYDVVRYVEKKLANTTPKDTLNIPDILLLRSEDLVIFDNFSGALTLVSHANPAEDNAYQSAQLRLDRMEERLSNSEASLPEARLNMAARIDEEGLSSSMGREDYMSGVERIKEYCLSGDIMQVVLSQRLSMPFEGDAVSLYRALRRINPSPYMFFLDMGDFEIVGASPEILCRLEEGEVTVRPIAGTRRRGANAEEDNALAEDMLNDPKEIAEHLMLIDLGRNDCGRVSKTGTVSLTEQMVVEHFSHVMHITSNVTGQVKDELDAVDVLRATHPAGTLSGAPKVRAMQIIDDLEPVKRSLYAGAVGHFGWDGDMDFAIAIRTGLVKDGQLHVQAGAGIVADSVPESEWDETMNKARALLRAAAMVMPKQVGKQEVSS